MKQLKFLNFCYDKKNISDNFNNFISSYQDNFLGYEHHDELIEIINKNEVHFVITKYNLELLKQIRTMNEKIHIIAILDELNHTHILEGINLEYIKFVQNLDCINAFIDNLKECVSNIDSKKSNIITFKNNFIYDEYNKSLFKNNIPISLTKKENQFLNFLVKNHNCSKCYEEINNSLWNGAMSLDSLRTLVKDLRKKTYKELIKNVSGVGYRIDIQS